MPMHLLPAGSSHPPSPAPRDFRRRLLLALRLVVSIALLWFLFARVDASAVWTSVHQASPAWLAVAVSLGLALTTVGVAVTMPERVLDAEFARQRWLAGASVKSLRVGDHDWTYLEAGQGPLIVMLHGFTGGADSFRHGSGGV